MRVFVTPAQLVAGPVVIRGEEHHYLARVRRSRAGDPVELVDGAGRRAAAVITRITDDGTELAVEPPELVVAAPPRVRVLLPLIKGDRMELGLEKLVEAGADEIVVWPAARSVVKLDAGRREARIAKYQAALQAAARQCGRPQVPTASWADSLGAAVAALPPGLRIVLDPGVDAPLEAAAATDVTIASGPEGGLAPDERELLAATFTAVGLGPRVVRAETAPVIATALIRAQTRS